MKSGIPYVRGVESNVRAHSSGENQLPTRELLAFPPRRGNNSWPFDAMRSFLFFIYYMPVILAAYRSGLRKGEKERAGEKRGTREHSSFKPMYAGKQGFRCFVICAPLSDSFFKFAYIHERDMQKRENIH